MISPGVASSSRPMTAPQQPVYQYIPILNREKTENNEFYWRDQVKNQIETNNKQMERSDTHIFVSKRDDPLTNLREVLRTLSNSEAFRYMKQCRLMVAKLKKCWVDVNEEVKSLTKNKEYLESALDHIRKDLIINKETTDNRLHRPATEPVMMIFLVFNFYFNCFFLFRMKTKLMIHLNLRSKLFSVLNETLNHFSSQSRSIYMYFFF